MRRRKAASDSEEEENSAHSESSSIASESDEEQYSEEEEEEEAEDEVQDNPQTQDKDASKQNERSKKQPKQAKSRQKPKQLWVPKGSATSKEPSDVTPPKVRKSKDLPNRRSKEQQQYETSVEKDTVVAETINNRLFMSDDRKGPHHKSGKNDLREDVQVQEKFKNLDIDDKSSRRKKFQQGEDKPNRKGYRKSRENDSLNENQNVSPPQSARYSKQGNKSNFNKPRGKQIYKPASADQESNTNTKQKDEQQSQKRYSSQRNSRRTEEQQQSQQTSQSQNTPGGAVKPTSASFAPKREGPVNPYMPPVGYTDPYGVPYAMPYMYADYGYPTYGYNPYTPYGVPYVSPMGGMEGGIQYYPYPQFQGASVKQNTAEQENSNSTTNDAPTPPQTAQPAATTTPPQQKRSFAIPIIDPKDGNGVTTKT